jgi:hypothetical protein
VSTVSPASRHDLTDPPVGCVGAVAADADGTGPPAPVSAAGLGRRCALPGAGGVSVAGRSGPVRAVVAGVCAIRLLAGAGGVGTDRVRADRRRGRAGQAVLAGVSGLDHCPGARARRRGQAGQREAGAGEPGHHALGRSRGGWSTKTHLAVDQRRGVISFLLTPGQAGDSPQMIGVLERIRVMRPGGRRARTRPDRVLADKAYSSRANRAWLAGHGIRATIPVPTDQAAHRKARGAAAADHPRSIRKCTRTGTPSNAASTCSNTTAASPPATTNSPSATPRPYTSPSSTTGFDDLRNRP